MIIRQTLNFGAHFVGGVILGALAVAAAYMCRSRMDHLEPRSAPPVEPTAAPQQPPEASAPAAAI